MKPDWKDAPEWANYLAQDEDGCWRWHEEEPVMISNRWWVNTGRMWGQDAEGWMDTVEKRP